MNAIDSAIMASLTRNESLNGIIANMPGIADNDTFVETIAADFVKKNIGQWVCSDVAKALIKEFRTKPGFKSAFLKAYLFTKMVDCCQFDYSGLAVLAIDRMAAEPDSEHAALWLNTAAAMLLETLLGDSDMPDLDEPF
jgi:hypothetical protein